ncbi:NRDE family protein [Chryseosolibacter indicus]|uniref:NRDE family protein n=1 Tax=Chryseosolibacter indicus TaxID=2782351 RepID=A0ABS5VL24_9BACT|nr:NRDE family protein [Chryseosolibacter indicus]MBT1702144.1 NRDE family protein [Chryseosolibacter indicus]
MCLIFLAIKNHPEYKLVVAANRDEFYQRKTAPADYWVDHPSILGGRDLEAGGTWLALNRYGKISMVTNYRDPKNINPKAPSRGHLVSDFLEQKNIDASRYMKDVSTRGKQYNGFNLITGTVDDLWYYSNYGYGVQHLSDGIFGLSNHLLDTPWPKVVKGKQKFTSALEKELSPEKLFNLLYDDVLAVDTELPDTGVGLERERALSSMFIKSPGYGTKCSTVILVDQNNNVQFQERVYDTTTFTFSVKKFTFTIES